MERTHKTWGQKWTIFKNDSCEMSLLYLNPKQRCSWHKHKSKFNQFFVVTGDINIKHEWGITHVAQGQCFTTKPGELHEFQSTHVPATIIEVMFVQYDDADIQREKLGGPIE